MTHYKYKRYAMENEASHWGSVITGIAIKLLHRYLLKVAIALQTLSTVGTMVKDLSTLFT